MRHFFYSLVIFLCWTSVFAQTPKFQTGQILLLNGEKKTGWIAGQFFLEEPKGVYFKTDESAKSEYLEFNRIQEILFRDSTRYIPHCTENTAQQRCRWLQTLLLGKVSLHQSIADKELFFLQEAGTFNAIRAQSFEGMLKLLKQKCPGFAPEAGVKFSSKSLVQLITEYSGCKNPGDPLKLYQQPKTEPAAQFYLGPKVGINLSNASIYENNYYGKGEYTTSPAFTAGVSLRMLINAHWSVVTELLYFQHATQSDSVATWPITSPNYSKVNIDLAFLEIPLLGQYYFSKNKISPFLQAGVYLGIPIKRELSEQMFLATPQELTEQPKVSFIGLGFGYGGGLGLSAQFSEKMNLQLLAQYTRFATTFQAQSPIFGTNTGNSSETPVNMSRLLVAGTLLFRL